MKRRASLRLPLLLMMAAALRAAARPAPLIDAAQRGDLAALRRLVAAGSPINERDASGRNAVLAATQRGQVDAARWLISQGADVNAHRTRSATAPSCWRAHAGTPKSFAAHWRPAPT